MRKKNIKKFANFFLFLFYTVRREEALSFIEIEKKEKLQDTKHVRTR